jgi:hypothetical protein
LNFSAERPQFCRERGEALTFCYFFVKKKVEQRIIEHLPLQKNKCHCAGNTPTSIDGPIFPAQTPFVPLTPGFTRGYSYLAPPGPEAVHMQKLENQIP